MTPAGAGLPHVFIFAIGEKPPSRRQPEELGHFWTPFDDMSSMDWKKEVWW
jgi:hypothetical protein